MAEKRLCGDCNGKGFEDREVKEISTGRWTKERFTCKKCGGRGWVS